MREKSTLNKLLVVLFALGLALPGFAADYGVTVNQTIDANDGGKVYRGTAAPWFSLFPGEQTDLYLSAGVSVYYGEDEWQYLPELYRFAALFRPYSNFSLEAGRLQYRDIRGVVASGLFDGLSLSLNTGGGSLSARVLYTGLLYKKTADIVMTAAEWAAYNTPVSYDDGGVFWDSYFAPRRMIGGIRWEAPDLGESGNSLALEGIGQADLNGGDELLHSGYFSALYHWALMEGLGLELGGTAALVKRTDIEPAFALAASAKLDWDVPGGLQDRLTLLARYNSAKSGTALTSFPSITTANQGYVFRTWQGDLSSVQGGYRARLHPVLWGELGAVYFFRAGEAASQDGITGEDGDSPFLGREFRLSFTGAPFSDLSLALDCGLFVPQSDAALQWRVTGGLIFTF
jgi:hypothetical protein